MAILVSRKAYSEVSADVLYSLERELIGSIGIPPLTESFYHICRGNASPLFGGVPIPGRQSSLYGYRPVSSVGRNNVRNRLCLFLTFIFRLRRKMRAGSEGLKSPVKILDTPPKFNLRPGKFLYAGFLFKFSIDDKKVNPKFIEYFCQFKQYRDWILCSTLFLPEWFWLPC